MLDRREFLTVAGGAAVTGLFPALAFGQGAPVAAAAAVLTRGNDNDRSYFYRDTTLTQANVKAQGIKRLYTMAMPGDARGAEAQALVLPNVLCGDGKRHDVVVLASMSNAVFGFDYATGAQLWTRQLGRAIQGGAAIDMHTINDHWGLLSTGVIDADTGIWYGVSWESVDGTPKNGKHFVHSLNVGTGVPARAPVALANVTFQPPNGGKLERWGDQMRKQRSSLTLTSQGGVKTIFFAAGTVLETTNGSAGWVIAYDVASNRIAAALALSAGFGAGVWMAGSGLSVDDNGDLLFETGNGSFDPSHGDYGECVCRVRYTPPVGKTGKGSLAVVDWWSPYSDAGRVGEDPTQSAPREKTEAKLAGANAPTSGGHMPTNMAPERGANGRVLTAHMTSTRPMPGAEFGDEDLGSAGPALIRRFRIILVYGKDGIAYMVNLDNMGKTQPGDFANAAANYAKLAQPPIWYSYYPGNNVNATPQVSSDLDFIFDNKTRHLHSTSPQFFSVVHGQMLACWGENGQCRVWSMAQGGAMTFLADSDEVASINSTKNGGGMPGGFMCISANGAVAGTALLWAIIPYGDGNAEITNGRLLVYDLENYARRADGSAKLNVLWDSEAQAYTFVFPKFNVGVVSGGRFILPRYDGTMDVLGLA